MSGIAATKVESQIGIINGYATAAISAANSALSSLADLDLTTTYPTAYSFSSPNYSPEAVTTPSSPTIETAPTVNDITIPTKPTKPTYSDPVLGTIYNITLPDLPSVSFPTLDITAPIYNVSSPLPWSFTVGDVIITDDPMIQAVLDRLTANIETGGTGLSAAVEAAIWARGLEREEQQLDDSLDKSVSMWAKKGFSLPDGELADSLMALQNEYLNRKLDRSREIEIKQADLEQVNLFKSMELGVNLASNLINMLIKYEELVFQGQEATAKFANEYIDLQIKAYMSKVEAYKATAQTYEMIIRAEIAKIETYKAQIDAQRLIGEVNNQTVQIYTEKIKATAILAERYKTEVQAMVSELETEKAKIESNKIQFDIWAKKADVAIAKYNGEVEQYKAESVMNVSTAELYAKQAEASLRAAIAAAEVSVKSYEVSERGNNLKAQVLMEAAKGVAQATSAMAAGAMAAMSAHASMKYDEYQPFDSVAQ
jgi:hypothetical protein